MRWAEILTTHKIETFQDILENFSPDIENELKKIPGQKSGISISYFKMLCGYSELTKPDRHIIKFLSSCLNRNVNISEAQELMTKATSILNKKYRNIDVRLLDYSIWNFMS